MSLQDVTGVIFCICFILWPHHNYLSQIKVNRLETEWNLKLTEAAYEMLV